MRLGFVVISSLLLASGIANAEWTGEVGLEGRWHWQDAASPLQKDKGLSISLEAEYNTSWDGGDQCKTGGMA